MRKLFERIVMGLLIEYGIECGLISSMSIAGLKGKSAIDALNVLTSDVYRGWDRRVATYAALMDVKSCYPSIQHDVSVARLERYYCISGQILTLLADLLQNTWTQTVCNGIGSWCHVSRLGIGQGRTSRQLLNLLYLDLIFHLIENPSLFRIMTYVDDLIIWSTLRRACRSYVVEWMQTEIDRIIDWLRSSTASKYRPLSHFRVYKDPLLSLLNRLAGFIKECIQCDCGGAERACACVRE